MGRPETPQGYELPVDGNVITEEIATQYADIAHNLRLTPQQAQGVSDYYKSTVQQTSEGLSLIHISEPTRRTPISYAVFCLKKKK